MKYSTADSGFKPPYIPGETPYSWVSRYHLSRPNCSWRVTNKTLFGKEYIRLNPLLPAHLKQIAQNAQIPPETLLFQGTGYSLFAYVQGNAERASRLKRTMMLSDEGDSIASRANLAASKLPFHPSLNFCPVCSRLDHDRYGVPYWHCEHQLYGVWSCPIHKVYLSRHTFGDGGINHDYILPTQSTIAEGLVPPKMAYLSNQITSLHQMLNQLQKPICIRNEYRVQLTERGYMTTRGSLRWQTLQQDLMDFWSELFSTPDLKPFETITDFHFVPQLIHTDIPMHYFKHVLLIGFLCESPTNARHTSMLSPPFEREQIVQCSHKEGLLEIEKFCLTQLAQGKSLNAVARNSGKSLGYLKQLALRHSIPIGRRRKTLSEEIERSIWRQAFIGKNRTEIARHHQCSVGTVESIIQSHNGLSQWRAHVRHIDHLKKCREELSLYIHSHPLARRIDVQDHLRTTYTWLFKHDKEWLYSTLPPKEPSKHTPSVNWETRDIELSIIIERNVKSGISLSAIDRQSGGHQWLTKYREKLPRSTEIAKKIIAKTKNSDAN